MCVGAQNKPTRDEIPGRLSRCACRLSPATTGPHAAPLAGAETAPFTGPETTALAGPETTTLAGAETAALPGAEAAITAAALLHALAHAFARAEVAVVATVLHLATLVAGLGLGALLAFAFAGLFALAFAAVLFKFLAQAFDQFAPAFFFQRCRRGLLGWCRKGRGADQRGAKGECGKESGKHGEPPGGCCCVPERGAGFSLRYATPAQRAGFAAMLAPTLVELLMATGLLIELTYKASHYVSRLDHPVHSSPHFHTWKVVLRIAGELDAHEVQQWMHENAPHFAEHGDRGVEDIADWWIALARKRWHKPKAGVKVLGISVMREDGIGAYVET